MLYSDFDSKNIPKIVDLVENMWAPPEAEKAFRRLYAEYVVRSNICGFEYSIQGKSDSHFLSAAFACKKHEDSEKKALDDWFNAVTGNGKKLTEEQKNSFKLSRTFLDLMDERVYRLMNDDDIKLALFVSLEKGAGYPLLQEFMTRLKDKGYKNMYLWTDRECNYDWYFRRGFELVEKSIYEPFSRENAPYDTFVFRKKLI